MDSSSTQNNATSRLCANGCGFFGTSENRGLCSKCYSDYYIKQEIIRRDDDQKISRNNIESGQVEINKLLIDAFDSVHMAGIAKIKTSVDPQVMKSTRRCGCCNKKVGLLGFVCRCGETFCGNHRYPESHPCDFDFKSAAKIAIRKENPVCRADKISDRI